MERNSLEYRKKLMKPVVPPSENLKSPVDFGKRGQGERSGHRSSIKKAADCGKDIETVGTEPRVLAMNLTLKKLLIGDLSWKRILRSILLIPVCVYAGLLA